MLFWYYHTVWIRCHLSCSQSCFSIRKIWRYFEESVQRYTLWSLQLCSVHHWPVPGHTVGYYQCLYHLFPVLVSLPNTAIQLGLSSRSVPTAVWNSQEPDERYKGVVPYLGLWVLSQEKASKERTYIQPMKKLRTHSYNNNCQYGLVCVS